MAVSNQASRPLQFEDIGTYSVVSLYRRSDVGEVVDRRLGSRESDVFSLQRDKVGDAAAGDVVDSHEAAYNMVLQEVRECVWG